MEPHPGPQRRRAAGLPRCEELSVADVAAETARRYDEAVRRFKDWLALRGMNLLNILEREGMPRLAAEAVSYLREGFREGTLSSYGVNNMVAGLRRLLLLAGGLGASVGDVRAALAPIWRVVRSWHIALPPEFRAPVPAALAVAIATWGCTVGHWGFAAITLLGHHALLRPDEARTIRVCDLTFFGQAERCKCAGVYGVVKVMKPKTRRLRAHAAHQHVLLECPELVAWLAWVVSARPQESTLWRGTAAEHLRLWNNALAALQCAHLQCTPAGLCGGGATEHFLRFRDVLQLRRRSRWTQLATLDKYLQESVVLLYARTKEANTLGPIVQCGLHLFSALDRPPPPHLQPT